MGRQWYEEYCDYVINQNISIEHIREVTTKHFPSHLYRFSSFRDEKWKNEIYSHQIRLSNPNEFNDPFDCEVCVPIQILNKSKVIKEALIRKFNPLIKMTKVDINRIRYADDAIAAMNVVLGQHGIPVNNVDEALIELAKHEASNLIRDQYKMICFSENLTSILMWSHYAQKHTGYCLEYMINSETLHKIIYPVVYSEKRLSVSGNELNGSSPEWILRQLISKSSQWAYEQEWRLISERINLSDKTVHVSEFSEVNVDFEESITAVYLGNKVSSDHEKEIFDRCNKQNIKVYKMELDPTEYKLVPKQLM